MRVGGQAEAGEQPAAQVAAARVLERVPVEVAQRVGERRGQQGDREDADGRGLQDAFAHRLVEVVVQGADRARGGLLGLGLGDASYRGPELRTPAQLCEFHPGSDLVRGGIGGKLRQDGPHQARELRVGVPVGEGGVDEVGHQLVLFGAGERGESVHEVHFHGGGAVPCDGPQDRPAQPQGLDLYVEGVGVRLGDFGE
ncbi:hypothetical protein [Streptomyces sp. AN091965]|uniref:hypothetical protein n=1 Tax=Streptomyces sp. AN091965 TaxID=2927803 RepID=UPI0027E58029|nr:hypothetical protein [Streptomyces sp. AN091965]